MALDPAILKARIDLRVCELKLLAAWTASQLFGRRIMTTLKTLSITFRQKT
jgi:hypothetical protein